MSKNPNCDNDKCTDPRGQVRTMPTGGGGNIILCRTCWENELRFRQERNKELGKDVQFDLPSWESSLPYGWTITEYPGSIELCDEHGRRVAGMGRPNSPMSHADVVAHLLAGGTQ